MFRAIVGSFFSNVFQLSKISKILITDRHSFPVIYVFINYLLFKTLSEVNETDATDTAYWKHLLSFLFGFIEAYFFFFIQFEESIHYHHV